VGVSCHAGCVVMEACQGWCLSFAQAPMCALSSTTNCMLWREMGCTTLRLLGGATCYVLCKQCRHEGCVGVLVCGCSNVLQRLTFS
jgi:hypothetical protein